MKRLIPFYSFFRYKKMKNIKTLLTFCLLLCLGKASSQVTPEVSFLNYYYNLNLAINANENERLQDSLLIDAFNSFPRQDSIPMHSTMVNAILKVYERKGNQNLSFDDFYVKRDDVAFINQHLLKKHHIQLKIKDSFYKKDKTELNHYIDTMANSDQYPRVKLLSGRLEDIDTNYVADRFKRMTIEGSDKMTAYLALIFEKFGYFGTFTCRNCFNIIAVLAHTDNYDNFLKLNKHLLEMVKRGYLSPNAYAWAHDRAYNQKYGTFYYYFCLNQPFNTENYIPVEQLSEKQKQEINNRRKSIGIPPLPYSFEFLVRDI